MTTRDVARAAAGVLVALAVIVALYLGYWWLRKDTTDRTVGVDNRNTGTQTAWRDEAHDKVEDFELLDPSQPAASALRRDACDLIARLTDPYVDDDLAAFQTEECS